MSNHRFRAEDETIRHLATKTRELEKHYADVNGRIYAIVETQNTQELHIKYLLITSVVLGTILALTVVISTILLLL